MPSKFCLAASMSGIMSALQFGLTQTWLSVWPRQFLTAWLIAFLVTQVASRIAFPAAIRLRRLLG